MCDLPKFYSEQLLVGFETSDDAAVYKLNEDQAVIQTLDFFTPIVDNPYDFGAIAAANALSDVYAMGGVPTLAMNIVGFPNCLDTAILKEIMRGGADKVKEANALLVGGHSIQDDEPKYGLSVMGLISPNKIWKNIGAKVGDAILLTKPIGMGIITTALKEDMLNEEEVQYATRCMSTLNKIPTELAIKMNITVNACTDVTGFGLLGHLLEMASGSQVLVQLLSEKIPFISSAFNLAEMGIIPAGAYKNRYHAEKHIHLSENVSEAMIDMCFDPQTSGGLLLSIPENEAELFISALRELYDLPVEIIGTVNELSVPLKDSQINPIKDAQIYIELL